MANLVEQFKSLTKYWWALLILGLAIFTVGIVIFVNPAESYLTMAVVFAVLMIVSGIIELVIAFTERYMMGRGWLAVSGAIELILGILLLVHQGLAASVLPLILGFWLLFRGISLIGVASEMRALKVSGMGWTIAASVLLILCSLMILFNPVIGVTAVVVWVGISFLMAGVSLFVFSIDLVTIRNRFKKLKGKVK